MELRPCSCSKQSTSSLHAACRFTITTCFLQGTYNKHTEAISDRNNELHRISEQLTEMKTMMEER